MFERPWLLLSDSGSSNVTTRGCEVWQKTSHKAVVPPSGGKEAVRQKNQLASVSQLCRCPPCSGVHMTLAEPGFCWEAESWDDLAHAKAKFWEKLLTQAVAYRSDGISSLLTRVTVAARTKLADSSTGVCRLIKWFINSTVLVSQEVQSSSCSANTRRVNHT